VKGLRNTSIHQLRAISCRADNKVETISCRADKQQQSFLDPSKVGGRSTKNIKKKSYKYSIILTHLLEYLSSSVNNNPSDKPAATAILAGSTGLMPSLYARLLWTCTGTCSCQVKQE